MAGRYAVITCREDKRIFLSIRKYRLVGSQCLHSSFKICFHCAAILSICTVKIARGGSFKIHAYCSVKVNHGKCGVGKVLKPCGESLFVTREREVVDLPIFGLGVAMQRALGTRERHTTPVSDVRLLYQRSSDVVLLA